MPAAIPFDVPYGPPIVLDRAQEALAAAAVEAGRRGWKMNIADLDSGGQLAALVRMDGTQLGSIAAAQHEARVAALFSRETRFFESGASRAHGRAPHG